MKDLQEALRVVVGGEFSDYYRYYLEYLKYLVNHYTEDDLTDSEKEALDQLDAMLLHNWEPENGGVYELAHAIYDVTKYGRRDRAALPQIKSFYEQMSIKADIASLLGYVKRKAVKAGDWPLKQE